MISSYVKSAVPGTANNYSAQPWVPNVTSMDKKPLRQNVSYKTTKPFYGTQKVEDNHTSTDMFIGAIH